MHSAKPPINTFAGGLLIFVLSMAAYLPALFCGYVWDDTAVWDNYLLEDLTGLWKLWTDPSLGTNPYEEHYWPVTYTSFWIEARLWGLQPFSLHLVNIILHALNSMLLWRVLGVLGVRGAWFGAALFAVHPAHVESVAWIIERKDLLSTMFYLLSALMFMRFAGLTDDHDERGGSGRATTAASSIVLFVLAMLCKSVAFSLPLALGLVLLWKRGPRGCGRVWSALAVMFLVGCLIARFDIAVVRSHSNMRHADLTPVHRIVIAGRALWFYAGKLLWPMDLTTVYPRWKILEAPAAWWIFPGAAAGAVLAPFALRPLFRRRESAGAPTAVLFFCVTLGPTLGFIDYGYMVHSFVADRFQYLASAGLIAAAAAAGSAVLAGAPRASRRDRRTLRMTAAGCVLAGCACLTARQSALYHDLGTLFEHAERRNPDNWLVQYNLGTAYLDADDNLGAVQHLRRAIAIRPNYGEAHSNLSAAFERLNDEPAASYHRRLALQADPDDAIRLLNQGLAAMRRGEFERAVTLIEACLKARPDQEQARLPLSAALLETGRNEEALAIALEEIAREDAPRARLAAAAALTALGRKEDAIAQLDAAVRTDPEFGLGYLNRGIIHLASGRPLEALAELELARDRMPDSSTVYQRLGEVCAVLGRREDAILHGRRAVELDPDSYAAILGLGLSLLEADRPDEALIHLVRAGERRPELALPQMRIADAYARTGKFALALNHARKSVMLEPENAEAHMVLGTVHARAGSMDEARAAFEESVRLAPDSAEAKAFLERARRGTGN